MALLHRAPKNSLSISKIAALLVGTTAFAAVISRFVVPYSIAALSYTVPRLWSSIRLFLVPPYLFIIVHLIIVTIWKLSDQKLVKNPNDKFSDAVKTVDYNVTPSKTVSAAIPVESEASTPISGSKSAESCVTTDSEENSAVSSRFESEKIEEQDAADFEDMWRTIVIKKSATWEKSSETAAAVAGDRVVTRSVTFNESPAVADGNDDLNQMFEAFIKKHYDQIRSC